MKQLQVTASSYYTIINIVTCYWLVLVLSTI